MRVLSSIVRALTTVGSVVLLWAASASPASATPVTTNGQSCEAQPTAVRKLGRHPRSFGGPLKRPAPLQFGLTDPTARLRRATRGNFNSNPAVIQSDAPAAHINEDGHPVPSLLLVGVLPHAIDIRPRSPTCSPRAPRGPPLAA